MPIGVEYGGARFIFAFYVEDFDFQYNRKIILTKILTDSIIAFIRVMDWSHSDGYELFTHNIVLYEDDFSFTVKQNPIKTQI